MMKRLVAGTLTAFAVLIISTGNAAGSSFAFEQINMVSSVPGLAPNTDANLINPWGLSFGPATPFWAADQGSGLSTLYTATGGINPLVVTVPPLATTPPTGPTGPTGTVFVGGQGFTVSTGGAANFAFATLSGTIDLWGGSLGTNAEVRYAATNGAIYTGLTLAAGRLYAADAFNNTIDVFSTNFTKLTLAGNFIDPNVPAGFSVYNVENVGGKLYVEYAPPPGSPLTGGSIGVFDTNGNFLQHIADPHLISPWGITLAPLTFGGFGGSLLVGNFGDGKINAFDPLTGAFQGTISDASGNPIVNDGLWALAFRAPVAGTTFNPNALYFAAGINGEQGGLIGRLEVDTVPEPATLTLLGIGLAAIGLRRRGKN